MLLVAVAGLMGLRLAGPGSEVADLQIVGRWPAYPTAVLASDAMWWQNDTNRTSTALDDAALSGVVARLCDDAAIAAAGGAAATVPPTRGTTWAGDGERAWVAADQCRAALGRGFVSCRGVCIPRAQCYAVTRPEPCAMLSLGSPGNGFAECEGGCVPRGRCTHVLRTPRFELTSYVGTPRSLENRTLGGGALMLPPGVLGGWNETAARMAAFDFFNTTTREWGFNASLPEPPVLPPPPIAVCVVRWRRSYLESRRLEQTRYDNQTNQTTVGTYQTVASPLPAGDYKPARMLEQNVTLGTEVVSLMVRGAWSSAALGVKEETEPAQVVLSLPALQMLLEPGRERARTQRALFRYCGRWGEVPNTTAEDSDERWLLEQLDRPEVVTLMTARPTIVLAVANISNCTGLNATNATYRSGPTWFNETCVNNTVPEMPPPSPTIWDRSDTAQCTLPLRNSSDEPELVDLAVLTGPTRWAPIVPIPFAYMTDRPELSGIAMLVTLCSFLAFGVTLACSVHYRRTEKADRAATPGWLKQTAYARALKHDLHPVLSLHTVLHTLRNRWSLAGATIPGPVAGDPFDMTQRFLVVLTAGMVSLGVTAAFGAPWRQESCLAPCSAQCYSVTLTDQTQIEWTIRSDRQEIYHRADMSFGDCDEECAPYTSVPVQLPPSIIVVAVICAQIACSILDSLFRWLSEPYLAYLAPEHVESVTVRACGWFRAWLPVAVTFDFCGMLAEEFRGVLYICWHRSAEKREHDYTKRAFDGKLAVSMPHGDEEYGKNGITGNHTYEVGIRKFHRRLYPSSWTAAALPYGFATVLATTSFGLAVAGSSAVGGGCEVWSTAWLECAATAAFVQLAIVDPAIAVIRMLAADILHVGRWKKVVPVVREFTTEEIQSLFEELDTNNSGALERDEVLELCKKLESGLLGVQFSEDDLEGAWVEMDADGKGDVSLGEFLAWWSDSGSGNLGAVGGAVTKVLDGSAVDPTGIGTVAVWHDRLEKALEEADSGRIMRLRVQVVGCAGLPPKDMLGRNDVFASLEMIGAFEVMEEPLKRTTTVHNGGSDPRWPSGYQTLAFDTLEVPHELEVVVFDEDVDSADDLIGAVTVSLPFPKGKPAYGDADHGIIYLQAWHALIDERGYPAGSILLKIHWAPKDLTTEKDAAAMEHEARELDAEEQGLHGGDKGQLLAIGYAMFDDKGGHEIEEWKQHEDQGITVGVRGHACDSVRKLVGNREALAFHMIQEVLNPFRTNRMNKKQRKRLNVVLTEFVEQQSEAAHRGSRDWLMSAASAHVKANAETDSEDSEEEEEAGGVPGSTGAGDEDGDEEESIRPRHRDRHHDHHGGASGQAAYMYGHAAHKAAAKKVREKPKEEPKAKPRPGTATRVRGMANAVQADESMHLVFREQAAAKLQLLKSLYDESLISAAIASARQEKVFQEMDKAGVSYAGLGHRYL